MPKLILVLVFCLLARVALADSSAPVAIPTTSGTPCTLASSSTNVTLVGFSAGNIATTSTVITFYDTNALATTSTANSRPFLIPGSSAANQGGGSNMFPQIPALFLKGLVFCLSGTPGGATGVTANQVTGTVFYH